MATTLDDNQKSSFEPYVKKQANPDGFLDLKGFHRVVNAEMQAIKKLKALIEEMKAGNWGDGSFILRRFFPA